MDCQGSTSPPPWSRGAGSRRSIRAAAARRRAWGGGIALSCLLVVLTLGGCSSTLSDLIVETPNHGKTTEDLEPMSESSMASLGIDETFRVEVGPPEAVLDVWVMEPHTGQPPRGTVLVLHGFLDGPRWMLGKADDLADAGYRAVLVALRGRAGSTGDYSTFGVIEKHDLSQVIDELERRGLITGRVGVFGMSYGASTAIELAGIDDRVDAVVAVAGFSSMRHVTPHFMSVFIPILPLTRDAQDMQSLIDEAGRKAGFNPDDASAAAAIARTDAPVLIVHGTWDALVPVSNAHALAEAANDRSELVLLPGRGHVGIWMDLDRKVERRSVAWFDRWLIPG